MRIIGFIVGKNRERGGNCVRFRWDERGGQTEWNFESPLGIGLVGLGDSHIRTSSRYLNYGHESRNSYRIEAQSCITGLTVSGCSKREANDDNR